MKVVRAVGIAGLIDAIVLVLLGFPPPAAAVPPLPVDYQATIYGDFAQAGNTVTTCPPRAPPCLDALHHKGSGVSAQNNGHPMVWVDVDGSPATYTSSSGRLAIPPGARIAYAVLTWAGNTTGAIAPPGSPRQQPVSVTVNGKSSRFRPQRYAEDNQVPFYSARAELTGLLHGMSGPLTITVGNVWTPRGYDRFGGWSVLAVWVFDGPHPRYAPARRHVTVYDGAFRLGAGASRAVARAPSLRPAGGRARVGLTAFEGDWAVSGDRFLVNGHDPVPSGNFFASAAEGALNPRHPNNMSVDVRTVEVPAGVLGPGDRDAELTFTSERDAYLVRGVAVSTPMPELVAATTVDRPAAHAGEEVTQTVRVTNPGDAPAVDIRIRTTTACDHRVPRLDAGATVTVACTRVADPRLSTEVTGASLIGDRLSARAETAVEVLRPALAVTKTVVPNVVLSEQAVGYEIVVTNSGNTPLSTVVDDDVCDTKELGVLGPGESRTVSCSVVAGDDGITGAVTVSGTDRLGKRVTSTASAGFSVVHPKVTLTVVPSTNAVRPGQAVLLTVTVTNQSTVPLDGVRVGGAPAECARDLGTLAPRQSIVYTCRVVVQERLTTALVVTATPVIGGQAQQSWRDTVRGTATVIVSVVPRALPPLPPPVRDRPPVFRRASEVPLPSPVPVASLIAGLAVLGTFVSIGGIAASASRPKR